MTSKYQAMKQFRDALITDGVKAERCDELLALASRWQLLAEIDCSCPETPQFDGEREQLREAFRALLGGAIKQIDLSGDPRGCCVKLHLTSGRWNTWGGKEAGYGVPTKSRTFEQVQSAARMGPRTVAQALQAKGLVQDQDQALEEEEEQEQGRSR